MATAILKCYDSQANKLWKSKHIEFNSLRYFNAIKQAQNIIGAKEIWVKVIDKHKNKVITYLIKFPPHNFLQKVQKRYTGSDGVTTWLYPTRPSAYPLASI